MREIVTSPGMLAEAREALPALKARAMAPASRETIMEAIARRFALFPQPHRSEEEWAAWWGAYFEALDGITAGAVEVAMAAWVKLPDSEFLPRPGKLRELASMTPNRDVRAYTRAKAAIDYRPEPMEIPHTPLADIIGDFKPRIIRDEPTAADKARVRAMWEECRDKLTKPADPVKDFKPTPVATNDSGVSLEMLKLRQEQAARP